LFILSFTAKSDTALAWKSDTGMTVTVKSDTGMTLHWLAWASDTALAGMG